MMDWTPPPPLACSLTPIHAPTPLIRRNDIKSLYVAELSAMSDDLDEQVDIQQMTDLLTYIKTSR